MITLKSSVAVYAASIGALVVYNIRWRYLKALFARKAKKLPVVEVKGKQRENEERVPVILFHGMWHDAWYFERLQQILAERGYTSYAVSLLPGERLLPGGSQKELVEDLELTLKETVGDRYVLLGHSQGGLVTQSALRNSKVIRENAVGAVLLGTYPLGFVPPLRTILKQQPRNMYTDVGYAFICMFGKLMNARYTKHIFLMTTTDETDPEMSKYIQRLLKAPSDGLVTMSHFPSPVQPVETPALVLGAECDIIYPPHLLSESFDERFPNATHRIAKGQAHCFVDPGWERSMAEPLLGWLDDLVG